MRVPLLRPRAEEYAETPHPALLLAAQIPHMFTIRYVVAVVLFDATLRDWTNGYEGVQPYSYTAMLCKLGVG